MKRKHMVIIGVQATAKSRRVYKMRGSRLAIQGRPRRVEKLAVQLAVGDDDDDEDAGIVRHKLPAKKVKSGHSHSLNDAVLANKRPVKKH